MPYKCPIKQKEYKRAYNQSLQGKISQWKQKPKNGYGLICESKEEYEYIYDRWLNSENCEECNIKYTETNKKCMDHCHHTGLFRNILCHSCNSNKRMDTTTGIPNISKDKNGWQYKRRINGKIHRKWSKDLEWLKQFKIEYEKNNIYIN